MLPIIFAALAGLCWGVGELCTKAVLSSGSIGPWTAVFVRMAVALPLAAIAYVLAYHALKVEPRGWWRADAGVLAKLVLGAGVAAGFGGVLFFYLGLSAAGGDISKVKPIAFALAPTIAVVLGWLVLGEPMSARKAIGAAVIVLGVVILTSAPGKHGPTGGSHPTTSAASQSPSLKS